MCIRDRLWVVERGWDKEYGGLFYYQDYMGYPTDKLESQMKLWWVHAETINAFLLAHKLTGRQELLDLSLIHICRSRESPTAI